MLTADDNETNGFFTLFPFFSSEEKEQIMLKTSCNSYQKEAVIFGEGEIPQGLTYLSSGKVKIVKKGILDKEQITRLVQRGQLLGFRAVCAGERYMASARAIETSTVCTIAKDCFLSLMQTNSHFALSIAQHAMRALGFADLRMVALTQKHMRARLADSLLMLANTYGMKDDCQTLDVCLSRTDLANLSNMTTPNVIRTLSAFQDEGLLSFDRYAIRLLNMPIINRIGSHG
jgi:CRP-like cAMP-binding protein